GIDSRQLRRSVPEPHRLRVHGSGHYCRSLIIEQKTTIRSAGIQNKRDRRHYRGGKRIAQHLESVASGITAAGHVRVGELYARIRRGRLNRNNSPVIVLIEDTGESAGSSGSARRAIGRPIDERDI